MPQKTGSGMPTIEPSTAHRTASGTEPPETGRMTRVMPSTTYCMESVATIGCTFSRVMQ